MGEKMMLEQVRTLINTAFHDSQLGMPVSLTHSEADSIIRSIDARLATPAQTVDIEAVRCAINTLRGATSAGMPADICDDLADKLSQAIGDKT